MMYLIREKIRKNKALRRFRRNNPDVVVDNTLQLKGPEYITCGNNVRIGANCKLLCWDSYSPTGDRFKPQIVIGDNVNITRNLTIQSVKSVIIQSDVLIASDVFIIDYNHGLCPLTQSYLDNPLDVSSGVEIRSGSWIGNNVIILPGVVIGEKSIIGAGSVVTKNIPSYSIAVGNPAKVIKKFDTNINRWVEVGE